MGRGGDSSEQAQPSRRRAGGGSRGHRRHWYKGMRLGIHRPGDGKKMIPKGFGEAGARVARAGFWKPLSVIPCCIMSSDSGACTADLRQNAVHSFIHVFLSSFVPTCTVLSTYWVPSQRCKYEEKQDMISALQEFTLWEMTDRRLESFGSC